jgi:hypothetical protein
LGEGGFALLMVVVLLSFIVVLLVGLAAYTRIETSIAGNSQRQAQARENALLALNVAVGQLQRYAGPDTRVTATAQNFGGINNTRYYTGVWPTDPAAYPENDPLKPLTWLVSGNEFLQPDTSESAAPGSMIPNSLKITPAAPGARTVDLIGRISTGSTSRTNYVAAPLSDIQARGVPGTAVNTDTVIGRYAWWVGDQGVKAPVAVADTSSAVTFAPYDSADLRGRIRQQIAVGAGAADTSGAVVFEPRHSYNSSFVPKIVAPNQFAFLRNSANGQLGLALAQRYVNAWSPNNFSVLADTKNGGLRQDLSLAPGLLGSAFSAWVNYPAYMEKLVPDLPVTDADGNVIPAATPTAPTILPEYGSDPLRRRYVMTPHLIADNGSHQVGPVLTYFLITFNVRTVPTEAGNPTVEETPLEVRARWLVSMWNPYTSALVPENLRIEVSGLPTSVQVLNDTELRAGPVGSFSLMDSSVFGSTVDGSPLLINLPWSATASEGASNDDRQSWLPGRVYSWRSVEDTSKSSAPPLDGYSSEFYSRTLSAGGEGVIRPLTLGAIAGEDLCHLEVQGAETLAITIYAMRSSGAVRVATLSSPQFVSSFSTTPQEANKSGYQFSYVFRLAESVDTPANPEKWLTTDGLDVRRRTIPSEAYVVEAKGNDPAQYNDSNPKISNPDRLLDRATDSLSYNEDVPLFELPRSPLLSLGALQHFRLPAQRPFMIGNSWGANYQLNGIRTAELFDRFFFSGLVDGVIPGTTSTGDLILPNPLLKPLRKPDRSKVTIDEVRTLMNPPTTTDADGNVVATTPASSASSKYFLQGGAFNLNSVNAAAWAAVLRSVRFPSPQSFSYLNASVETGTAADTDMATVQSGDAQFFRFSQSAQETYQAEAGQSAPGEVDITPPSTELFRRGMRTLTATQVAALAAKIVELVGTKQGSDGPFRSMDEFLSPNAIYAGVDSEGNVGNPRSLLEAAIADAGINAEIAEFSSQWLTQADIMTALAPVLFPRSDTFVIRTYGEVVNPATLATEGKAWCEALVQRVPEYLDGTTDAPEVLPGALTSELNKLHGRRFKVVSFRWLTRTDI